VAVDKAQGDLIYERDLSRNIKLLYEAYGLSRTRTYEIFDKKIPNDAPLLIGSTGPTILFDGRDNIFNPSRGYNASTSFEFASPYLGSTQTVSYYRTVNGYTRYVPLGKLVFATEGKFGYVKNLSTLGDGAIPQIKTFFLGGQSTIRGFNAATEAFPLAQSDVPNGVPTEEYYLLAKTEMRFPITGNLGGVVFYDGGKVAYPGYQPQFQWRDSVGTGIRYITPVGPVSLEFGWKLNRDTSRINEDPFAIHFSIGVF
jgi:outer membrane protein insertion porin family